MSDVKSETRIAKVVHFKHSDYDPGPLEVVINRGVLDGIKTGDRFLVFGTGPHIADPDTGEDPGILGIVRGRGKVVHIQDHLAPIRTVERQRTRRAKRIVRELTQPLLFGRGTGLASVFADAPHIVEEEIAPEIEMPFESVQLGDLAKPI